MQHLDNSWRDSLLEEAASDAKTGRQSAGHAHTLLISLHKKIDGVQRDIRDIKFLAAVVAVIVFVDALRRSGWF